MRHGMLEIITRYLYLHGLRSLRTSREGHMVTTGFSRFTRTIAAQTRQILRVNRTTTSKSAGKELSAAFFLPEWKL